MSVTVIALAAGVPQWRIDTGESLDNLRERHPTNFALFVGANGIEAQFNTTEPDKAALPSYIATIRIGDLTTVVLVEDYGSLLTLINQLGPGTFTSASPQT